MIEVDYQIVRNENDEKRVYVPSFPKGMKSLVKIEGPNSSGKSTLLHILALGLFGINQKNLYEALREKLKSFIGAKHQTLQYAFRLTNNDGTVEVHSEKEASSDEIAVYEVVNGIKKNLSPEVFHRKYKLIYDIPQDPLNRLRELTKELNDELAKIGRRIADLREVLVRTINEVAKSRNPQLIEEVKTQIAEYNQIILELTCEIDNNNEFADSVEQYFISREYLHYKFKLAQALENVAVAKNRYEEYKKNHDKHEKKVIKRVKTAHANIENIEALFGKLTFGLKVCKVRTSEDYLSIWNEKPIKELLTKPENRKIIFNGIDAFRGRINVLISAIEKQGGVEEANLLSDLIQLLNHYSPTVKSIPGTGTTIPQLLEILQQKYDEHEEKKKLHDAYKKLLLSLTEFGTEAKAFISDYDEMTKLAAEQKHVDTNYQAEEYEDAIDEAEKELKRYASKYEFFLGEINRIKLDESACKEMKKSFEDNKDNRPYIAMSESDLEDFITEYRDRVAQLKKDFDEKSYHKRRYEADLAKLERQEPHKYQGKTEQLNTLLLVVQKLEQKFVKDYRNNLERLIARKEIDEPHLSEEQRVFYSAVANYLARRVKILRHVDKEYEIDKINLIAGTVITKSGKVIHMNDLGTGQSQSAYIKGLLAAEDGRKIIALIDEVAMMDSKSMNDIYDILRKQYSRGDLLAGIVVQRGETFEVTEI